MALHGVVDCLFNAGSVNNYSNEYVTLFNFLTGTQAQSIGISRIAYNTGSGGSGTGIDYVGTANAVGQNAWSVWCWLSASTPWYLLIQSTRGTAFGTTPGNPGLINAAATTSGFSCAFAFLGNGASPWNGTTNNNGRDTKGSVVWRSGSTGNVWSDMLYVFPRSNSGGGTHFALKENTIDLCLAGQTSNARTNFVCDENTFCFLGDGFSADQQYGFTYFGKFNLRSGSSSNVRPYVMIAHSDGLTSAHTPSVATYGTTTGGSYNTVGEGGICVPEYTNGSLPLSAHSGTCAPFISVIEELYTTTLQPNLQFTATGSMLDEGPFHLFWNETPYYAGFAGTLDWIRQIITVSNLDVNTDKSRAYFGSAGTTTTRKVSIPWNGVTTPGAGSSMTGSIF